jgi:hypothetical protein
VIDNVFVQETSDNGVETAGLDGVQIDTVVATPTRSTSGSVRSRHEVAAEAFSASPRAAAR